MKKRTVLALVLAAAAFVFFVPVYYEPAVSCVAGIAPADINRFCPAHYSSLTFALSEGVNGQYYGAALISPSRVVNEGQVQPPQYWIYFGYDNSYVTL